MTTFCFFVYKANSQWLKTKRRSGAGKRRQEILAICVASTLFITDLCLLLSHLDGYTLIKKKRKFSSYIRTFRRERLQSHIWGRVSYNIWGNAQIFSHIWRGRYSEMILQPLPSEFPYVWGKFNFLFSQCNVFHFYAYSKNFSSPYASKWRPIMADKLLASKIRLSIDAEIFVRNFCYRVSLSRMSLFQMVLLAGWAWSNGPVCGVCLSQKVLFGRRACCNNSAHAESFSKGPVFWVSNVYLKRFCFSGWAVPNSFVLRVSPSQVVLFAEWDFPIS